MYVTPKQQETIDKVFGGPDRAYGCDVGGRGACGLASVAAALGEQVDDVKDFIAGHLGANPTFMEDVRRDEEAVNKGLISEKQVLKMAKEGSLWYGEAIWRVVADHYGVCINIIDSEVSGLLSVILLLNTTCKFIHHHCKLDWSYYCDW